MTSNRPPAVFVGDNLALDFLNTTATPGEFESSCSGTGMIWSIAWNRRGRSKPRLRRGD
jgi:hypothetical protein